MIKPMHQSLFIILDGIDGVGTTTHSKLLAGFLSLKGLKTYLTQEPSSSEIGKLLRIYLKDKRIPASTDALLFAADRVLHYKNEIKKKLEEGYIVILNPQSLTNLANPMKLPSNG
jgi:dTMP kinase